MQRKCHPLLKPLIPVVKLLGATLGGDYEVLLHDLSREKPVIVAIENGQLTGRTLDTPLTELGRFLMTSPEVRDVETLVNYPAEAENGRTLRSSAALIRDENGRLIGFLCINYDMTRAQTLKDMAEFLTETVPLSFSGPRGERFESAPNDQAQALLERARKKLGKPLRYLDREERLKCMEELDAGGFFKLKGAVPLLTREMGKSRYTLYADIRAIRNDLKQERE